MIVLASASKTRRLILKNAGVSFAAVEPKVDESALLSENPNWTPAEASLHLARAKAVEVSLRRPGDLVIGADQVLSHSQKLLSKPPDIEAARLQLLQLRGATHELVSSAVCARDGSELWNATSSARMTMRDFSNSFLEAYLLRNGVKSLESVGAYQLEGLGSQLFDGVDGDYFTILGLPLLPLMRYLRAVGELRT